MKTHSNNLVVLAHVQLKPFYRLSTRDVTHVRKCTRPSPAFPYCKRRKAGRGLGTRLAFCGILNNRLSSWLEEERIIHEAQNDFRQGRSCLEHIFALSTLVDTRKKLSLDTFVCFVDFQKAYDKVNRGLLLQKLQSLGLEADFVQIIAALYPANTSCVHVMENLQAGLKSILEFDKVVFYLLHYLIYMSTT